MNINFNASMTAVGVKNLLDTLQILNGNFDEENLEILSNPKRELCFLHLNTNVEVMESTTMTFENKKCHVSIIRNSMALFQVLSWTYENP